MEMSAKAADRCAKDRHPNGPRRGAVALKPCESGRARGSGGARPGHRAAGRARASTLFEQAFVTSKTEGHSTVDAGFRSSPRVKLRLIS